MTANHPSSQVRRFALAAALVLLLAAVGVLPRLVPVRADDRAAQRSMLLTTTPTPGGGRGEGREGRDPAAAALAAAQLEMIEPNIVYGPESGRFRYDNGVSRVETGISLRDFAVTFTISNPFLPTSGDWYAAIQFRATNVTWYWLVITSYEQWFLSRDTSITLAEGELTNLDTAVSATNQVTLIVTSGDGVFYLNGQEIARLDVSDHVGGGDVVLVSEAYDSGRTGDFKTLYSDFTVYQIGFNPTPTPTATPNPISKAASIGKNRGEIPVGGADLWTYIGRAGERLDIAVDADAPANDTSVEERIAQNLLDTYVIVRAPDGTVLAEADDIQDGVVTNTFIGRLRLPEDGVYQIEVRSWENTNGGAYTLTIGSSLGTAEATPTPGS
jgi:hypothetical protein